MAENRQYDHEYKVQAVKLAKEIGQAKAAKELGIPKNTMYGWVRANRLGNLDLGAGSQTPQSAMTLNEELLKLRQQVKELEKENRRLKKENDFLEEASAFFAASRLKSKGISLFSAGSFMSADRDFTSILQTKTARGNISHWRMP